jgi:15-cis-phytoene synthase
VDDGTEPGSAETSRALDEGAAEVAALARASEPDRHLAALLAPPPERAALLALAAFAGELGRIPYRAVREPVMGEIRLQWWRTALGLGDSGPEGGGDSGGHAVAEAMRATIRRCNLPAAPLNDMIDAHALELRPVPFADDAAQLDFLDKIEGALFLLACRVLGFGNDPEVEAACLAAGRAYGLVRLLQRLPSSLALGRVPLAQTQLAAARLSAHELLAGTADGAEAEALLQACFAQIRSSLADVRRRVWGLSRRERVAFLPLALVGPYLRRLERQGGGALREEVQIVPLARVWSVAAAHVLGRL